jgi:hypothetical protein
MGRAVERRRLQTITDHLSGLTDSASNGTTSTDLNLPTEVCTGTAKTKEQSQRRAFNLIPIMVSNDRPTCKDRHAAELIMARRNNLHLKAEYIAADLSSRPDLFPCSPAADHTFSVLMALMSALEISHQAKLLSGSPLRALRRTRFSSLVNDESAAITVIAFSTAVTFHPGKVKSSTSALTRSF